MQVTITIPPHLETALNQTDETPEELILQLLTQKLMPADAPLPIVANSTTPDRSPDPLFQLAGCITSDLTDVAQNHDYYLGQALYGKMPQDE
jgi:hypothetical protein